MKGLKSWSSVFFIPLVEASDRLDFNRIRATKTNIDAILLSREHRLFTRCYTTVEYRKSFLAAVQNSRATEWWEIGLRKASYIRLLTTLDWQRKQWSQKELVGDYDLKSGGKALSGSSLLDCVRILDEINAFWTMHPLHLPPHEPSASLN